MKNGKDTNLIYDAMWFLDGVMEGIYSKSQKDLEVLKMRSSAQKGERLGLGVLGWHTYLKKRVFLLKVYLLSLKLGKYFRRLKLKVKELRDLAEIYGEPLWCVGTGMRNTHLVLLLLLLVIVSLVECFARY